MTSVPPPDLGLRFQNALRLAELARAAPLTPSEHQEAARVVTYLLAFADKGDPLTEKDLAAWLAPLLCKDRESAARFHVYCQGGGRDDARVGGSPFLDESEDEDAPLARRAAFAIAGVIVVGFAVLLGFGVTLLYSTNGQAMLVTIYQQSLLTPSNSSQAAILAGLLLFIALVVREAYRQRQAGQVAVARKMQNVSGTGAELTLQRTAGPMRVWPQAMALARRIAQDMPSRRQLAPERTAVAFAQTGGRFRPVWSNARSRSLVIIERQSPQDHQAKRYEALAEALVQSGLKIERWFSDRSRLRLTSPTGSAMAHDISHDAQGAAILYLGSGEGLTDVTGAPRRWSVHALAGSDLTIVTPRPRSEWSDHELALRTLAGGRLVTSAPLSASARERQHIAWTWSASPSRWVHEGRPDSHVVKRLLADLKLYFAEPESSARRVRAPRGFLWLCVCAIFPALRPDITDFLGARIFDETGQPLRSDQRATLLAALPWMRAGRMPAWLRRELIAQLPRKLAARVRRQLREALSLGTARDGDGLQVVLAGIGGDRVSHDTVAIEFAARRDPLALRLTESLSRVLVQQRAKLEASRRVAASAPLSAAEPPRRKRRTPVISRSLRVSARTRQRWSGVPSVPVGGRLKRGFDIVFAGAALILLAPLLALTALAIRLDSPGPIIFKQVRGGFAGKPFRIWKFRTMAVAEPPDGLAPQTGDGPNSARGQSHSPTHDMRITRLGRFLRASAWDELPQLINVLIGDMSIVGPRPHAVSHDNRFEQVDPRYRQRQHARPGITGVSQVYGRHSPYQTDETTRVRVSFDIEYVQSWTFWTDIRVLLDTIRVLFRRSDAI